MTSNFSSNAFSRPYLEVIPEECSKDEEPESKPDLRVAEILAADHEAVKQDPVSNGVKPETTENRKSRFSGIFAKFKTPKKVDRKAEGSGTPRPESDSCRPGSIETYNL